MSSTNARKFTRLTSSAVHLPADDVDTDQIIPARFLKVTSKEGLGAHLFSDWRARPDFPLLAPGAKAAKILVAGLNFGCGSSREHAPWALVDWGFRAIVARSFADIFRGNAMKNGLLPVAIGDAEHARLVEALRREPRAELTVDLQAEELTLPDGTKGTFAVPPFAKHCLLEGLDELGYIQSFQAAIEAHERKTEHD